MAIKHSGGLSKVREQADYPIRSGTEQHRTLAPALPRPLPPARRFQGAFSPREARHNFVVEILPKPAWNKSRPYLYTCARCKWAYRVNDSAGSIIPLDGKGEPLPEPLRSRRAAAFAEGPCGAFPAYALERPTRAASGGWLRRTFIAMFSRSHQVDSPADSHRPDLNASAS